ncbi:CHC2 zinc finger domain-containing protein, partial [Desulfobacterales bacterium HSG17]|nr:CHC2 zinc finger domain-containing protein [Desulfobacterales bacterium HSG17]
MYIPEEKISEILNTSDIVDIISQNVILKKSGSNFFGLCPFHSEKTPSFSVNTNKQIYYCFGCGAGGDALNFLKRYHGITFPEAAKMLARKYNITIETRELDPAKKRQLQFKENLFRLNKTTMEYFDTALKNSTHGKTANKYLTQRKISEDTINEFHLGF